VRWYTVGSTPFTDWGFLKGEIDRATRTVGSRQLVDVTQRMPGEEILRTSRAFVTVRLEGDEAAALLAFLETHRSGGYARPRMLVETDWVALHGREARVRVVDVRDAVAYDAGHIPGAVHMDAEKRPRDPSLVNGGWKKWEAEGRPTSREAPTVPRARFSLKETPALSCPTPDVLARRKDVVVLDTRSAAEFSGLESAIDRAQRGSEHARGAVRAGRVPGAVNVDWTENVTGAVGVFKPAAELKRLYESRGVTPDREIVAYCASGGRAAQTLFTLKLLGYPKVRLYYGSFSDYSARPEAPVEK
jgi:thiosulfate/3-mercaptopyruvate sulfurtransferase